MPTPSARSRSIEGPCATSSDRDTPIDLAASRAPFAAVSVFCTTPDWPLERILVELLVTRSTYAVATAGQIRAAGFQLLATFQIPHFDVVLPEATSAAAGTLFAVLGTHERNLYRRRR